MRRREFLSRFAAVGGAAGGVAIAASSRAQDAMGDSALFLRDEFKRLNDRMDRLDENQRRMLRALIFVASVSTGIDALRLLNGDLFS